ncbi:MAG: YkgJ family cysteine cluster protein [Alphaproteobacteria bacterium]|nr:YkgJ family cysteine cluster protein [Alphaproteobacteria bacterium]
MSMSTEGNGGDQVAAFLSQLRDVARGLVERTLGVERSVEGIAAMIEGANSMSDLASDRLEKMLPSPRHLDCGKGCSHCCRMPLIATDPARVFYLAHYLANHPDAGETAAYEARIAKAEQRPCVLLNGDMCVAYPVRPEACRAYNAFDSDACASGELAIVRGEIGARAYPVPFLIAAAIASGLAEGLALLGLEHHQVGLNAALRIVHDQPDALTRWLGGEPVFSEVRLKAPPPP